MLGVEGAARRAALTVFQRDVLVGYRFALNDESGKELMLGAIFDTERSGESLVTVNYQQRLGETWTVRGRPAALPRQGRLLPAPWPACAAPITSA